jgi:hypothetical protein
MCFEVTTAGTSTGTEPAWVYTIGSTTTDAGGVVWTCRGGAGIWLANKTYGLGDRVVKSSQTSRNAASSTVWECTTAGTSGATEPTWATTITAGTTTQTDNTVTWTARKASTWDNAHPFMAALFFDNNNSTIRVNGGDSVYVSSGHAEQVTQSAFVTTVIDLVKLGGQTQVPINLLCVDDTGQPTSPTTLATTAVVEITGTNTSNSMFLAGAAYIYGITFKTTCNSGTSQIGIVSNSSSFSTKMQIRAEKCGFSATVSSSNLIVLGSANSPGPAAQQIELIDPTFTFGSSIQTGITFGNGRVRIRGGTFAGTLPGSASSVCTNNTNNNGGMVEFDGTDFSGFGSSTPFWRNAYANTCVALHRNCKMPSSPTYQAYPGSISNLSSASSLLDWINCDNGGTNYKLHREHGCGTVDYETVIVRSGGASDGTTSISHKAVTNANSTWSFPMPLMEFAVWNDNSGSSKTATVEILADTVAALNNDDVWMEVEYQGASGNPQTSFINCTKSSILASNAAITSSSATWTTTGITNPNKMKLQVTFTPQLKGWVTARVYVGKASQTVYVDPMITIT